MARAVMCTDAPSRYGILAIGRAVSLASLPSNAISGLGRAVTGRGATSPACHALPLCVLAGMMPRNRRRRHRRSGAPERGAGQPHRHRHDRIRRAVRRAGHAAARPEPGLRRGRRRSRPARSTGALTSRPARAWAATASTWLATRPGWRTTYHVVPDLLAWGNDALENGSQTVALVATAGLGAMGTVVTGTEDVRDAVGLTDAGAADALVLDRHPWSAPMTASCPAARDGGRWRRHRCVTDWAFADDQLGASEHARRRRRRTTRRPSADCGHRLTTDEGTAAAAGVPDRHRSRRADGQLQAASAPDPGTIAVSGVVAACSVGDAATASAAGAGRPRRPAATR